MISDYITTFTKVHFTPLDPKPEDVRIEDIAHALSLMARANGHFKHFYSVAQHSINCAQEACAIGYNKQIQLACLLHDASEAYISDVTRPIKQNLPLYKEIEMKLQNIIYRVFGISVTQEDHKCVKKIDDTLLWHEFVELLGERLYEPEPIIKSHPDLSERRFLDVENEFIRLFNALYEKGDQDG